MIGAVSGAGTLLTAIIALVASVAIVREQLESDKRKLKSNSKRIVIRILIELVIIAPIFLIDLESP